MRTGSIKSKIGLIQYRYTGGVKLTDDSHYFTDHTSMGQKYVGPPTPEIDDAWDKLLHGRSSGFVYNVAIR